MYSTIPTHETEEQALLAVKSKQPMPIVWSPDSSKLLLGGALPDPSPDMYVLLDVKESDGAGALATGLLVMLPALAALAL